MRVPAVIVNRESSLTVGDSGEGNTAPKLEVGVLITPAFSSQLIDDVVGLVADDLTRRFPEFEWCFPRRRWQPGEAPSTDEPSALLVDAAQRRASLCWDFVIAITEDDLPGHKRPHAFSVLSRPLDAAIVSAAHLAGADDCSEASEAIAVLLKQALAHLAGLNASQAPDNLLYRPRRAADLARMRQLDPEQLEDWREQLREIADQRLEESKNTVHPLPFVVAAAWINRREIARAVLGARPWQLPYRLGRLTAAAVSMLAIVMMTAEAWDVGLTLSLFRLALLTVLSLVATTLFVTARQRLLPRGVAVLSEQSVVRAVASVLIVCLGILTAWFALAILALFLAELLFPATVVAGWAPAAVDGPIEVTFSLRVRMAVFVASLAATIGALGASFENQHYFQHVVLVDEEI